MKQAIVYIAVGIVALAAGLGAGWLWRGARPSGETVTVTSDTLYVRDTVRIPAPALVSSISIRQEEVRITDSIYVKDDTLVVFPITQKWYRGEDYEAWVSGYAPRLDSINVYPLNRYITETTAIRRKQRWGIGVQVGYGATLSGGQVRAAPYVGVGISYNIVRF